MDIKKFWNEGVSLEEYLKRAEESAQNPKTEVEKEFHDYYELGLQRMARMTKVYHPDAEQRAELKEKNFNGKILVITEPWCGDASAVIPVVHKFFEDFEFRITYRDQEPSLIDDYLTNGTSKSIPIVIFLDENFKEIGHWGPRPKYGHELFAKHKADPEAYTKDDLHNDLQVYYARNKGKDTIAEILEIL